MDKDIHMMPAEEMPVMMLVNEISKLFFDRMRRECEKINVQHGYNHILFHLSRRDGITQLDLVRMTHLKAPTVSVALQKMEYEGLVRRETDKQDQRQTRVYITDKGMALDSRLREKVAEIESVAITGIDNENEKILKEYLIIMRKNILEERGTKIKNEAD